MPFLGSIYSSQFHLLHLIFGGQPRGYFASNPPNYQILHLTIPCNVQWLTILSASSTIWWIFGCTVTDCNLCAYMHSLSALLYLLMEMARYGTTGDQIVTGWWLILTTIVTLTMVVLSCTGFIFRYSNRILKFLNVCTGLKTVCQPKISITCLSRVSQWLPNTCRVRWNILLGVAYTISWLIIAYILIIP